MLHSLLFLAGYTFNDDGTMQGPEGETTINRAEMREKLPMYLAIEQEGEEYSGVGFSTIFDSATAGTTSGVDTTVGESDGLRPDGTAAVPTGPD